MKKIITMVLTFVMCFAFVSCGGGAETVNYGDTITTEFAEIQISTAAGLSKIEGGATLNEDGTLKSPINNTMSYKAEDGQSYVALIGSFKNLGSVACDTSRFESNFVFDGGETYRGSSYVCVGEDFQYSLDPKKEGMFYLAAMIPDEVLESFTTCEINFGFNDGFEMTEGDVNACDYKYLLTVSRDEAVTTNLFVEKVVPVVQEVKKGDKLSTEFVEMTIKGQGIKEEVKFSKTDGSFTHTTGLYENNGKQYMYIEGTIKNVSKQDIDPEFTGTVVVDDYSYELDEFLVEDASSVYSIAPLADVHFVLYGEVPNELAENHKSATINFAFDEFFKYGSEYDECPYQFTYKMK